MKEIKEILQILNSNFIEQESVISDSDNHPDSLLSRLKHGIITSKYSTDREVANDLYGKLHNKHTFQLLKSKLRQKAFSTLLLLEIKDNAVCPRDATKHHLHRLLLIVNLLLLFGARQTAIKILEKITSVASRYLLNDILLQSASLMRSHYWFIGDKNRFTKENNRIDLLLKIISAENMIEGLYQSSTILADTSLPDFIRPFEEDLNLFADMSRIEKYADQSYIISTYILKINVFIYGQQKNYEHVVVECNKALLYLNQDAYMRNDALRIYFLLNRCEALFFKNEFDSILISVTELRDLIHGKNPNRILVERIAFVVNARLLNYDNAEKIITSMSSDLDLFRSVEDKDEWALFHAYLEIAKFANKIIGEKSLIGVQLPALSHNKHDTNISLLICEVVKNIFLKQYTTLFKLDKKMDNCIYRYLKGRNRNSRSTTFLKMLRIIIKEDYDLGRILKKTDGLVRQLNLDPVQSFVEILPYQELWRMLMQFLGATDAGENRISIN